MAEKKVIKKEYVDINWRGNAFTLIGRYPIPVVEGNMGKLESIFRNGLLGTAYSQRGTGGFGHKTTNADYERLLAEGNKMTMFFNIVGRHVNDKNSKKALTINEWSYLSGSPDKVFVLFDLSEFREGPTGGIPELDDGENGVYSADACRSGIAPGNAFPHSDYGFVMSPEVEREHFRGILFSKFRERTPEELEPLVAEAVAKAMELERKYGGVVKIHADPEYFSCQRGFKFTEELDPEKLHERGKDIAAEMLKADTEPVPVYDLRGTMWWPEQIPYSELRDE